MEFIKGIISHLGKSLFLVAAIGIVPSIAYTHSGVEQFTPYIMLFGLLVGLITRAVCALRHLSVRDAVLPSFGIYLTILVVGGFFLPGGASWSDIPIILVFSIVLGSVGLIPFLLGVIAMSFILNRGIDIFRKSRRKP